MDGVFLKIIGCGDAFGSGGRLNTCFYLESASVRALIDCGSTSLPSLKANKVPIHDLDAIIITHFHGDHFGGVPYILLHLATYGQRKALNIISPRGGEERLSELTNLLYPGSSVMEKLSINYYTFGNNQEIRSGALKIRAYPMIHTKEALPHGVRISVEDKVISYSGDTEWTDNLIPLADQADLFICECCFYTMDVKGHLSYLKLKEHLPSLNFKRILLTHFDKEMLVNLKNVGLDCAVEGERYEV